jgi:hypothetical protein
MSTDLAVTDNGAGLTLFAGTTPEAVIAAGKQVATALNRVIRDRRLYLRIGTRDHVTIEGWQVCGTLCGVFAVKDTGVQPVAWPELLGPIPDEPPPPGQEPRRKGTPEWDDWKQAKDLRDAWVQMVRLHDARNRGLTYGYTASFHAAKDGRWLGHGEGRCERSEANWTTRDDYALSSMAQTRGQSRALASALRFIVELADYATTPAEEATGPPPAPELLDPEGEHDLVVALQERWPGTDAVAFLPKLARRLDLDGVPEVADLALRAWAWWIDQPAATGNVRDTPPAPPTNPDPEGGDSAD